MKLSEFLKQLTVLRNNSSETGKPPKETEWIKAFFISAGVDFLYNNDNQSKINSFLKQVFAPSNGRTAITTEIASIVLNKRCDYYWNLFYYIFDNTKENDNEENIDLFSNLVDLICKDEGIDQTFTPFFSITKFFSPSNYIMQSIDDTYVQRLVFVNIILDYFYFLVRWEILSHSIPEVFLSRSKFRPDFNKIISIHFYPSGIFNSDVTNARITEFNSFLQILYLSNEAEIHKTLYFPPNKIEYDSPEIYYTEVSANNPINYNNKITVFRKFSYNEEEYSQNPISQNITKVCTSNDFNYLAAIRDGLLVMWYLDNPLKMKSLYDDSIIKEKITSFFFDIDLDCIVFEIEKRIYRVNIKDFSVTTSYNEYEKIDSKLNLFNKDETIFQNINNKYNKVIDLRQTNYSTINSKLKFSNTLSHLLVCNINDNSVELVRVNDLSSKTIISASETISFGRITITHDEKINLLYFDFTENDDFFTYITKTPFADDKTRFENNIHILKLNNNSEPPFTNIYEKSISDLVYECSNQYIYNIVINAVHSFNDGKNSGLLITLFSDDDQFILELTLNTEQGIITPRLLNTKSFFKN